MNARTLACQTLYFDISCVRNRRLRVFVVAFHTACHTCVRIQQKHTPPSTSSSRCWTLSRKYTHWRRNCNNLSKCLHISIKWISSNFIEAEKLRFVKRNSYEDKSGKSSQSFVWHELHYRIFCLCECQPQTSQTTVVFSRQILLLLPHSHFVVLRIATLQVK